MPTHPLLGAPPPLQCPAPPPASGLRTLPQLLPRLPEAHCKGRSIPALLSTFMEPNSLAGHPRLQCPGPAHSRLPPLRASVHLSPASVDAGPSTWDSFLQLPSGSRLTEESPVCADPPLPFPGSEWHSSRCQDSPVGVCSLSARNLPRPVPGAGAQGQGNHTDLLLPCCPERLRTGTTSCTAALGPAGKVCALNAC